ncbi:hypothetical protein M231_03541 [Tremella mesenterica]|uniref:Uncharacterized protein n=1 Tax=Tremella mesenterica TaxID=5217 RepID=A0A4Q1BMW8_TREME|nr:hypothetical protein M231_03541 [Tremella mesenterica]
MSRRLFLRASLLCVVLLPPLLYFSHSSSTPTRSPTEYARQLLTYDDDRPWFSSKRPAKETEDSFVNLEEGIPLTTYLGGIPGYTAFSNLYVSSSTFMVVADRESGENIPPVRAIMSAEKSASGGRPEAGEDRWRVVDEGVGRDELGKRAAVLRGTTYIFNDPPGKEGYLIYYEHFVLECFLGAARILGSIFPNSLVNIIPTRVWYPRCGVPPGPTWRDARGDNIWFLSHAAPGLSIEDSHAFEDRDLAGLPVMLERAVIVDRRSAHSAGGETAKWGKMNADVHLVPAPQGFWEPIRNNVMRSLAVDGVSKHGSRGLPVVVYVDRQSSSPKLTDKSHEDLVEALKSLTDIAEVHVTRLEGMTKKQKVDLISRTEILLGLHSDDLRTAIWMKATDKSTVIEIFEPGSFIRDHQLLASNLNHRHIVIHDDKIFPESSWRLLGRKSGTISEIGLDGRFVVGIIRSILLGLDFEGIGPID